MSDHADPKSDDDALSWDGDESLTAPPALPKGWKAVGKGSDGVETVADGAVATDAAPQTPRPTSNATLIALGIFGGVYLLYTIGWIVSGTRLTSVGEVLAAGSIPYAIASWIAAAAPAIWFALSLYLTRHSRAWVRFAWLVAGALLLVPWPFVMMGAGS